jgi:uncharacterized protein YaiI (UPF0178 family)
VTPLHVDAEACPVRDEAVRTALRHGVGVAIVTNGGRRPVDHPRVATVDVAPEPDAADRRIAARIGPGGVAVRADIVLAAACVRAGAAVLAPDGGAPTPASIGAALAARDLAADLRAADPFRRGGGRGFTPAGRSRFLAPPGRARVRAKGGA